MQKTLSNIVNVNFIFITDIVLKYNPDILYWISIKNEVAYLVSIGSLF